MQIDEIGRGRITQVRVRGTEDVDFAGVRPSEEAQLFRAELEAGALLRIGSSSWAIDGASARDTRALALVLLRGLPRVVWVVARPETPGGESPTLMLQVHEFVGRRDLPEPVDFAVDERALDAVRRKRRSALTVEDAAEWLARQVLIPGSDGISRAVLSAGASTDDGASEPSAFRLHGGRVAVDIARSADGRLRVVRVVGQRADDSRRAPVLLRGALRFVDATIAGRLRGSMAAALDRLAAGGLGYLTLWETYHALDQRRLNLQALSLGCLPYHDRHVLPDGSWRFRVGDRRAAARFVEAAERDAVEIEALEHRPTWLDEPPDAVDETTLAVRSRRGRPFCGVVVGADADCATIELRSDVDGDGPEPPEAGVLVMSLAGDHRRLGRRAEARACIAAGEGPMPQLGLIIEGEQVPAAKRHGIEPLSPAARRAFGGRPTRRQIEALSVALNTPDIALIQGPPGTGKTRTIAALQIRLAELEADFDSRARRFLLTSYQHDAVETVATATRVMGLPSIKVGRRRGETEDGDGFDDWRRARLLAVEARLGQDVVSSVGAALTRCRALAVALIGSPTDVACAVATLDEVRQLAAPHVSADVTDALLTARQRLQQRSPTPTIDRRLERALAAVRALPESVAAFAEDGPDLVYRALNRLERLPDVSLPSAERALLDRAAGWRADQPFEDAPTLIAVRAALLDRLSPRPPAGPKLVDIEVESALGATIDALVEAEQASPEGAAAVQLGWRDALANDPEGMRAMVERYTAVLAATCQQAAGGEMAARRRAGLDFDSVVVDEAARAHPLDLFIPMALAERRIVLVGDHRQLPHLLDQEVERALDDELSQAQREALCSSLFQQLFERLSTAEGRPRTVTLDEQYRMHPTLGTFVSETFYAAHGEGFRSGPGTEALIHELPGYEGAVAAWVDLPLHRGTEDGERSKKRLVEARWIADEAGRLMRARPDYSVGVIAFYRAQVAAILAAMVPAGLAESTVEGGWRVNMDWQTAHAAGGRPVERLRVGTVDAFQGKEFDVVLLSMTRSNDLHADNPRSQRRKYGHLVLANRLCVAMSRQKRLLIGVGDSGMLVGPEAEAAVPGLVRFLELCGGPDGIRLRP